MDASIACSTCSSSPWENGYIESFNARKRPDPPLGTTGRDLPHAPGDGAHDRFDI
jgi:hypothetical protein